MNGRKTTKPPSGGLSFNHRFAYVSGPDKEILERAKGFEPSTPTLAR
jgi:hypothetical protein